jgi:membrane protein
MASLLGRAKAWLRHVRDGSPTVDHGVRTLEHFNQVNGRGLAGAITYFALLSFFPLVALAFFVVGYLVRFYPGAQDTLTSAIDQVLPHVIGPNPGQVQLQTLENAATAVGLIGLVGLLYAGLGWLSATRRALQTVFEVPRSERPSWGIGRLRDLVTLVVLGVILVGSVAVTGFVIAFSSRVIDLGALGPALSWLQDVPGVLLGMAADLLLFYSLFRLLADPPTPRRALWQGALLGAVAFEALKLASGYLLAAIRGNPAFQVLGATLILLVWINYFSRVVIYTAAWAHTSASARAVAASRASAPTVAPGATSGDRASRRAPTALDPRLAFAAGAGAALAMVAFARRRLRRSPP